MAIKYQSLVSNTKSLNIVTRERLFRFGAQVKLFSTFFINSNWDFNCNHWGSFLNSVIWWHLNSKYIGRCEQCNRQDHVDNDPLSCREHTAEKEKKLKVKVIMVLVAGIQSGLSSTQQKTKHGMFAHTHSVITATQVAWKQLLLLRKPTETWA